MAEQKIGVGLIGLGGWAKYGHIPVLQALVQLDLVAVSSRRLAQAQQYAATFNIAHAFDDEQALVSHPEVDLVMILAPAPEHARLAKIAIAAGKDVYSEWPLTTNTADSEELLALAETKGVRHIVGLQRRHGQSACYLRLCGPGRICPLLADVVQLPHPCLMIKQYVSLCYHKGNSMTRQQIDHYLSIHRAQRDRAKKMLDERYFELEERNEETQWINVYLKHKAIVEALEIEKPDD